VALSLESPSLEVPLQEPLSPGLTKDQIEEKSDSTDLNNQT